MSYVKNFDYTGGQQTWSAPYAGYYKLEVWGAQGGTYSNRPSYNYGGYSIGIAKQTKSATLFINVGGKGKMETEPIEPYGNGVCSVTNTGGYNGGGNGTYNCNGGRWNGGGGGGGATHIATVSGQLKNLSSYRNTGGTNISKEILIVAGGGGGNIFNKIPTVTDNEAAYNYGGVGGGIEGGLAEPYTTVPPRDEIMSYYGLNINSVVSQISGYAFGQGATPVPDQTNGGGGGGWYGGYADGTKNGQGWLPGFGGSGYIGSSNLLSGLGFTKHMTCYDYCTTSTAAATRTNSNTNVSAIATADYSKTGNGYGRITWLGDTI